jgi:hypothetical protein
MYGKNWVDEDDPGEERVFGLGHGWCQGEAQRIAVERRLAADLQAGWRLPDETEIELMMRQHEDEERFRASYPGYRGTWPPRPPLTDVRDVYFNMELKQPYVDEPPHAPVPAVKLEPELDPIPDAIGQPPFVPRTGRPTA